MSCESRLQPMGARVLVKEDKNSGVTQSGIEIAGAKSEKTNRGTVISVGDGAMLEDGTIIPVKVKVGDRVMFTCFSGSPVKEKASDEEEYLILNERDILCKILPEDEE